MSVLSFRPSFDDALHHRRSAAAYRCSCARPIHCFARLLVVGEARSVPCPVPVRSRPDCSGIRRFLVGLHHLAMMPRRLVAIPSRPSMLPSSNTSVSQKITRLRSRERTVDPHSSCGVLSDTIVCVHREVVARTSKLGSRGYHFADSLRSREMTRIRLYSFGWVPLEQPVDESDGHPSSLRQSWPIGVVSSLSGAEVLQEPGASVESRSIVRRRDESRRKALCLLPWGF